MNIHIGFLLVMIFMYLVLLKLNYIYQKVIKLMEKQKVLTSPGSENDKKEVPSLLERYQASMTLSGVGDAMGYRKGKWEFNYSGLNIHQEMMKISENKGVLHLKINKSNFPYSDDTVMHVATAKGLIMCKPTDNSDKICTNIARQYKDCWKYMSGRAPGGTCARGVSKINNQGTNWNVISYSDSAAGCGAAMRSACIGLFLHNDIPKLLQISIESGRMTHHNPVAYLGAMVASYFTALAIHNIHPHKWIYMLFKEALPLSEEYVKKCGREVDYNLNGQYWKTFTDYWRKYAIARKINIEQEDSKPQFPEKYGVAQRQQFYEDYSLSGWPGACGIDSVIIAYDCFIGAKDSWEELCMRAMLHGGDNDSTGAIAGAWFGALYGYKGVPIDQHVEPLEDRKYIEQLGRRIYQISAKDEPKIEKLEEKA